MQEAVYLKAAGESDVSAITRILNMTTEEVDARAAVLTALQEAVYRDNDRITSAILANARSDQARRRL